MGFGNISRLDRVKLPFIHFSSFHFSFFMKQLFFALSLLSLTVLSTGCEKEQVAPQPAAPAAAAASDDLKIKGFFYGAWLEGAQEAPKPVDTKAFGWSQFKVSRDGTKLEYRVFAYLLKSLRGAHLHLGPAGSAGPVVVDLYHGKPVTYNPKGQILSGTITAADFVGPLKGKPFSALIDALNTNNIYTNLHSVEFPAGEIRGQID